MEEVGTNLCFRLVTHPCTVRVKRLKSRIDGHQFQARFEYEDWKGPYSFAEYYSGFEEQLNSEHSDVTARQDDDEALANGFWITFTVPPMQGPLADQILACARTLAEITESVGASLRMQIADDSVALQFEFPDEVRVSCEQYLLYFAQFLKDLGVGADTAITSEAGHVLFTVTPTNEKEALDRIRDALICTCVCTKPITPRT